MGEDQRQEGLHIRPESVGGIRRDSERMLRNETVTLEPADRENVDLLVRWTLDPVAQGPAIAHLPSQTPSRLETDRRHCVPPTIGVWRAQRVLSRASTRCPARSWRGRWVPWNFLGTEVPKKNIVHPAGGAPTQLMLKPLGLRPYGDRCPCLCRRLAWTMRAGRMALRWSADSACRVAPLPSLYCVPVLFLA